MPNYRLLLRTIAITIEFFLCDQRHWELCAKQSTTTTFVVAA